MNNKVIKYLVALPEIKKEIEHIYKDHRISEHLDSLYNLIDYQMKIIAEQRRLIIAEKHHKAWKQYYKAAEEYDTKNRRCFTQEELESRKR